jgi:hypothetical protein
MAAVNHQLPYRPLRAGVCIFNPVVNEIGTLGLIGQDGGSFWIVSCYHVLCRADLSPAAFGETIYQPTDAAGAGAAIAQTVAGRADTALDCAAAQILPGIEVTGQILNIPAVGGITAPAEGMRVLKSGAVTGVTEGVITSVSGDAIEVAPADNSPRQFDLSERGDSGALWIDAATLRAVALHRGQKAGAAQIAVGFAISAVLNQLNLTPLFT